MELTKEDKLIIAGFINYKYNEIDDFISTRDGREKYYFDTYEDVLYILESIIFELLRKNNSVSNNNLTISITSANSTIKVYNAFTLDTNPTKVKLDTCVKFIRLVYLIKEDS